jgi:hypothetical protein
MRRNQDCWVSTQFCGIAETPREQVGSALSGDPRFRGGVHSFLSFFRGCLVALERVSSAAGDIENLTRLWKEVAKHQLEATHPIRRGYEQDSLRSDVSGFCRHWARISVFRECNHYFLSLYSLLSWVTNVSGPVFVTVPRYSGDQMVPIVGIDSPTQRLQNPSFDANKVFKKFSFNQNANKRSPSRHFPFALQPAPDFSETLYFRIDSALIFRIL